MLPLGFPGGSAGKESACNVGDLGSVPGLGRSLEKGKATHSSILAWRIPGTIQCQPLFYWAPKLLQTVIAAMKLKDAYSLEGKLWPT